jgi:hypothetical protein
MSFANWRLELGQHTGTLRWVMMTVVSFPLTAIDVIPAPLMALNAYSVKDGHQSAEDPLRTTLLLTDLIQL